MEWLSETLCVISSSTVGQYISANWPAALVAVLSAFVGTLFGAGLAFLFERRDRTKLARDADLAAARQAQFALASQLNTVRNIWTQSLAPLEQDEHRWLLLRPFVVLSDYPKVPVDRLGYFLELKNDEGPNILGETMVEEERFFEFVRLLEQRNLRHENMQHVAARTGAEILRGGVEQKILKDITDALYGLAHDVWEHHPASIKTIRVYLEKRFPKYHTLHIE